MSVITERIPILPTPAPAAVFAPAPPIGDLAAAIGELLSQGPTDAFAFEHTLAGLVRAAREDRAALREALLPVADRALFPRPSRLGHSRPNHSRTGHRHARDIRDLPLATPLRQLHLLVVNAVWCPVPARRHGQPSYARHTGYAGAAYPGYARDFELVRLLQRLELALDRPPGMDPYALRAPADILTLRLAELAARIGDPAPVHLVSTPTDPDGWIEAETLFARISAAESAGWQPWPLDFDQALLRLDAPGSATVRAAQDLVSPAGRRLAGWLRGGRPSLPDGADLVADPESATGKPQRSPRLDPLITPADPPFTGPMFGHAPSTLIHLLRRGWYPPRPLADGSCWTACWPALLPANPDLISIAVAWHPHHPGAHGEPCPAPVLTELAQAAHAQVRGPDTYAAIARALTSRSPAKRADAAQAFAALAVSGSFDAGRFATALAAFATRIDRQVLRSVVPALQHVLTVNTAPAIGATILGWLPAILPPAVDQPLPYTSHLLNLAADALTRARARKQPSRTKPPHHVGGAIDTLTRLVNRPSRSAVTDAANGLLAILTPAP